MIIQLPDFPVRLSIFCAVALVVASLFVTSCRPLAEPPYSLAFALDGRAPRVIHTTRELNVPVTITNMGERSWDPGRIHLSYHWLWLIPREVTARSRWDVPYHEGIRTDLPAPVAHGGRIGVHGRILAPTIPGL